MSEEFSTREKRSLMAAVVVGSIITAGVITFIILIFAGVFDDNYKAPCPVTVGPTQPAVTSPAPGIYYPGPGYFTQAPSILQPEDQAYHTPVYASTLPNTPVDPTYIYDDCVRQKA